MRNGYLYGHVAEDDRRGQAYATIYGRPARALAEEQWGTLRAALEKDLARLFAAERARPRDAAAEKTAARRGRD